MEKKSVLRKMIFILSFSILFLSFGCNSSSDNKKEVSDYKTSEYIEKDLEDDFVKTRASLGKYGESGNYVLEYFDNAEPAQSEIKNNDFPIVVININENTFILNINEFPENWNIGKIAALKINNKVVYKRLFALYKLNDGRLAVTAGDANLLEVVENLEINSEPSRSTSSFVASSRKLFSENRVPYEIKDYNFQGSKEIAILEKKNLVIFAGEKLGDKGAVKYNLSFPEISLKADSSYKVLVRIDKLDEPEGLASVAKAFAKSIWNLITSETKKWDEVLLSAGRIVIGVSLKNVEEISEAINSDVDVKESLEVMQSLLIDKTRLKRADIILSGGVDAKAEVLLWASAGYENGVSFSLGKLSVPISAPIPITLDFEPIVKASVDLEAKGEISSGIDMEFALTAEIHILDGEIQPIEMPKFNPDLVFNPPAFDNIKGSVDSRIGLGLDSGISLAKLFSGTVGTDFIVVMDTDAKLDGDIFKGCINLDWDLYGEFSAQVKAESIFNKSPGWKKPDSSIFPIKFFYKEEPMGNYQHCWSE